MHWHFLPYGYMFFCVKVRIDSYLLFRELHGCMCELVNSDISAEASPSRLCCMAVSLFLTSIPPTVYMASCEGCEVMIALPETFICDSVALVISHNLLVWSENMLFHVV